MFVLRTLLWDIWMKLHFPFRILNGPTILSLSWSSDLKNNHGLARTSSGNLPWRNGRRPNSPLKTCLTWHPLLPLSIWLRSKIRRFSLSVTVSLMPGMVLKCYAIELFMSQFPLNSSLCVLICIDLLYLMYVFITLTCARKKQSQLWAWWAILLKDWASSRCYRLCVCYNCKLIGE